MWNYKLVLKNLMVKYVNVIFKYMGHNGGNSDK